MKFLNKISMDIFSLWKQKYMNLLLVFNFTCITDVFYPRSRCRGMSLSYLIMYQVSVNILEQNEQVQFFWNHDKSINLTENCIPGVRLQFLQSLTLEGSFHSQLFKSKLFWYSRWTPTSICDIMWIHSGFVFKWRENQVVIKFYMQLRSHLSLCLHTCEGDFEPFALWVLQLVDSHLLTNISYTWWKTHLDKW